MLFRIFNPALDPVGVTDNQHTLTLEPGLNIYEYEIQFPMDDEINFILSFAQNVDFNLVSLRNFEDFVQFNIDFDNNCFQSTMTLDTVEFIRGANMCFLEGGSLNLTLCLITIHKKKW